MFLSNSYNSISYLIKKIQFQLKTWKNSVEISIAYKSTASKKIDIKGIVAGLIKVVVVLCVVSIVAVLFINRDKVSFVYTSFRKSMIKTKIPAKKVEKKLPAKKPVMQEKTVMETDTVSESVVESVESTLVQEVPEIVKPVVKKHGFIEPADSTGFFIIVANKAFKSMYLLQYQGNKWNVVEEYDIAIGVREGKKLFAGDKKTPEGQYFIIGRKEHSELSIIYGPLAYVLNYPNEEDRVAGRTGQGIWIHGTNPDSLPIDTKGCLEMKNNDLNELSKLLKRGIGTPVLIVNNPELTDPTIAPDYIRCKTSRDKILDNYQNATIVFKDFIEKWKTAWQTKNMIEYTTFYDTLQFKSQGMDWNGWRERKLRTFDLYDTIVISISDIMITDYSDEAAIVKFDQMYKTNINSNEVAKKVTMSKMNDEWKITSESTCLKEELLL